MKKTLAVLAVLAVAAVAQAELLATWTFNGTDNTGIVSPNSNAANAGQVTFGNLSRLNGLATATTQASAFTANNWTASTDEGKAGIGFTLNVASGFEVADSVIAVNGVNRNGSGPQSLQWTIDGVNVGGAWSGIASSSTMTEKTTGSENAFTVSAGNNTLLLVAPGASSSGGRANLRGGEMRYDGKIQPTSTPAVPEPATMSLLGLGALAMALRRKLRK